MGLCTRASGRPVCDTERVECFLKWASQPGIAAPSSFDTQFGALAIPSTGDLLFICWVVLVESGTWVSFIPQRFGYFIFGFLVVGSAESRRAAFSMYASSILVKCFRYYFSCKFFLLLLRATSICSPADSSELSIEFPGAVIQFPSVMAGHCYHVDTPRLTRSDSAEFDLLLLLHFQAHARWVWIFWKSILLFFVFVPLHTLPLWGRSGMFSQPWTEQ